ncbi:MAG: Hsp20/alpha crystallin family protein [Lachnospiraceae bacterium]|nr:Hsp20/alpha crystallin family protein [Lachnospiraceae bacterium]
MLMPSIFGEDLFDNWMDFPFERENQRRAAHNPLYGKNEKNLMKTDIRETETSYELDIDLPGFKKENVNAQLENGYLTINAAKGLDQDEKDSDGKYIRRERFIGHCSRSFYVGTEITQQDIRARFENGILKLSIPKKDQKEVEQNKYISIEG